MHIFGKEYHWSKSQINEIYPEEASVLLKIIAVEREDKQLQEKIDYYMANLENLYINHGDPEKVKTGYVNLIEKLQGMKIEIIPESEDYDEDLPDFAKLQELKQFQQSRR